MATLLIVEDDKAINELMVKCLSVNGHSCLAAYQSSEAVCIAKKSSIDLILLDINLPDMSGFQVMEQLKEIPVIFVTARNEIRDKVRGLDGGAQDYIVKPFHVQELISRVNAALRHFQKNDIFCLDNVKVDLINYKVYKNKKEIILTNQEFKLLKALICNKNITLTREQLLSNAWGWDYEGEERTVDVHIRRLRKKLNWEKYIKTIYKIGYRLELKD